MYIVAKTRNMTFLEYNNRTSIKYASLKVVLTDTTSNHWAFSNLMREKFGTSTRWEIGKLLDINWQELKGNKHKGKHLKITEKKLKKWRFIYEFKKS